MKSWHKNKNNHALTLVELMVIILVVVVLLMLVFPQNGGYAKGVRINCAKPPKGGRTGVPYLGGRP
jgi:Tfp pilus assembly protein FimT